MFRNWIEPLAGKSLPFVSIFATTTYVTVMEANDFPFCDAGMAWRPDSPDATATSLGKMNKCDWNIAANDEIPLTTCAIRPLPLYSVKFKNIPSS